MFSPSTWFRRLWPLLVVLNATACQGAGCIHSDPEMAIPLEFNIGQQLSFCLDDQATLPAILGTLSASVPAQGAGKVWVRPIAPASVRVEVMDLGTFKEVPFGSEFVVDQSSTAIRISALEPFDTAYIDFEVFLYAKDDPDHPDRTVNSFTRRVQLVRQPCPPPPPPPPVQRTAVCPGTEEVRKVVLSAVEAVSVAGKTCWQILDAATFATISDKGSELGQPDSYAVDIVAAGGIEAAVAIGPTSARINQWIPDALAGTSGAFGPTGYIFLSDNITDFLPYGGPGSPGGVLTNFTRGEVRFLVYDDGIAYFALRGDRIASAAFPGAAGNAVSALAAGPDEDTFVVTSGTPGSLWVHRAADRPAGAATKIGDVGDDPRRLRRFGNLLVTGNFGSDSLTVARADTREIVRHVQVGDGPIGIDGKILGNGDIAIVSTGFNDDTYTITVLTAAGDVVSSETSAVPEGGLAPGHAIWHEDGVLISCHDTGEIVFVPATGPS
jgi:hypothetical protein